MTFYYLDASAWVKRYHQEIGTDWVRDLFRRKQPLACASIGLVEVIATLARKRKAGAFDQAGLDEKMDELIEDWDDFIQIHFTPEAVLFARESAYRMALRGADAIHLGSALILSQRFAASGDEVVLVASDRPGTKPDLSLEALAHKWLADYA